MRRSSRHRAHARGRPRQPSALASQPRCARARRARGPRLRAVSSGRSVSGRTTASVMPGQWHTKFPSRVAGRSSGQCPFGSAASRMTSTSGWPVDSSVLGRGLGPKISIRYDCPARTSCPGPGSAPRSRRYFEAGGRGEAGRSSRRSVACLRTRCRCGPSSRSGPRRRGRHRCSTGSRRPAPRSPRRSA